VPRSRSVIAVVPALWLATVPWANVAADEPPLVADQELGARVGVGLDLGGVGPGGFAFAGSWLYRLTETLWFDGRAAFLLGGGGAICTFPASGPGRCDGAVASGFAVELLAGVRGWLPVDGTIRPWLGGGIGAGLVGFSGDDLAGAGVPFWAAAGARARVADAVAVGAEVDVTVAVDHYGRGIGWQGAARLSVLAGVDFAL
jgi:hypothetical protein